MLRKVDEAAGLSSELSERIEDFLDHLVAPTVGRLSRRDRERFRDEARSHVLGYWEDFARDGHADPVALELALREFGEPGRVGAEYLAARTEGAPDGEARRVLRRTGLRAFAFFGLAAAANEAILQVHLAPAYPDRSHLPYLGVVLLVSPLVAGALCGATSPGRLLVSIARAVPFVAVCTLPAGLSLLPDRSGLWLSGLIVLVWTPLGGLAACGAAFLARESRSPLFWRESR